MEDSSPPSNVSFKDERYEVITELGRGGMGIVYKCYDSLLDKEVAVKIIGWNFSNEQVIRFHQEAKALAQLAHPNILGILHFGHSEDDSLFLVMELLEGRSLDDILQQEKTLPYDEALTIFIQICDGLAHAHKKDILHRDIKPSNVFVAVDQNDKLVVKITDFGLAKLLNEDQRLTKTGIALGSPPYMSPEQSAGKPVDERADIYSVGCLMFESLIGEPPFFEGTIPQILMQHIKMPPPKLRDADPERNFPEELERIIDKCLAKDPDDRYEFMSDLRKDLQKLIEDIPTYGGGDFLSGVYAKSGALLQSGISLFRAGSSSIKSGAYLSTGFQRISRKSHTGAIILIVLVLVAAGGGWLAYSEFNKKEEITLDAIKTKDDTVDFTMSKKETYKATEEQISNYDKKKYPEKMWVTLKKDAGGKLLEVAQHNKIAASLGDRMEGGVNWLDLNNSDITDAQLKTIETFRLMGLRIGNCRISDKGVESISKISSLQELSINNTGITDKGVKMLLDNNKNLTLLNISDTAITDKAISYLGQMPKLSWLAVDRCPNVTGSNIDVLKKTEMNLLSLSGSGFRKENLPKLKGLNLFLLNLGGLKLDDKDVKTLVSLHFDGLNNLILSNNGGITDQGLHDLMSMKYMTSLRVDGCPLITKQAAENFRKERIIPPCTLFTEPMAVEKEEK